ncbi:PAS domain S-box protein [Coleofasciculus chthonoplastes]|uniref:PAS domain S-box protein n=1 Tax=Coleofasciculus chthonoplastes TaxID=64178 RepID=UPI0032F7C47C
MLNPVKSLNGILTNVAAHLPLQTVLIVPFVLQIVGTVGLVGYLSYRNGQRAVENLAYQLIDEVDERVEQNVYHYLESPHQVTQTLAASIQTGIVDWKNFPGLERYFAQQLQIYGTVSSMAIITEEREFLNVGKLLESDSLVIRVLDQSTNYAFHYYTANLQGQRIKRTQVRYDFDPHTDPPEGDSWYQATKQAGKGIWHPLVSLSQGIDKPLLLIANFLPFNDSEGRFQGILVATFFLPELAEFLEGVEVGKTGQVFMVNQKGELVASSTGEIPFKPDLNSDYTKNLNPQDWRLPAQQSRNPLTQASVKVILNQVNHWGQIQHDQTFKFNFNDKSYFLHINPIQAQSGLNWCIITVVPESDFMAEVYANTRTTIGLCVAALILSIVVGICTARWVTKPIMKLNLAADAIARGEWGYPIAMNRGDEVGQLAESFQTMAVQLQQYFTQLQSSNQALTQSEHHLTQILEAIPVGISVHDLTGQLTYANEKSKELLGIETLPDTKIDDLAVTYQVYHSDTKQLYPVENLPVVRAINGEQTIVDDLEIHHPDQIIPVEAYGTPLLDKTGTIIGAIVAFFNITERKQAEALQRNYYRTLEANVAQRTAELRDANERLQREMAERQLLEGKLYSSEQQIRTIFEAINDIVLIIDHQKSVQVAPTKRTYLSPEDSNLLTVIIEQFFQDPEELWFSQVQQVLDTQQTLYFDYHLTLDNHEMWFTISIALLSDQAVIWVARDISDRKLAEDALRTSEYLYRAMARNFPNGAIFLFDHNLRYLVADGQALAQGGYSWEALHGKTLWEVLPPDTCAIVEPLYHAALAGIEQTQEISIGGLTYLCQSTAVRNDAGTIIAGMVVTQNITERKQAEESLRESEAFLRSIYEGIEAAVFIVDVLENGEFRYVSINPTHELMSGLRNSEIKGKTPQEALTPDIAEAVCQRYLRCLAAGEKITYEHSLHLKGKDSWWISNLTPLRDSNSRIYRLIGTSLNISDRKQIELQLKENQRFIEKIINASPQLLYLFDPTAGTDLYINRQSLDILGYNPEEIIRRGMEFFLDVLHPDDLPLIERNIKFWLTASDSDVLTTESRFRHKDGSWRWLLSREVVFERDENNRVIRILGTSQDITELKEAEEALRRYERIVSSTIDAISLLDRNYTYQIVNQAYLDGNQKRYDEIVGHSVSDLMGNEVFEQVIKPNLDRCLAGEMLTYQEWFDYPGGKHEFISVTYIPYLDGNQQISGVVVNCRNLTQLKQIETQLRQTNQEMQAIFDAFPDILFRLAADGTILDFRTKKYQDLYTSPESFLNHKIQDVLPTAGEKFYAAIQQVLTTESLVSIEYSLPLNQGEQYFEARIVPLNHNEVIALTRNISDRKQAELALAASNARFAGILEIANDAIISVNEQQRITLFNQGAEKMFGYKADQVLGEPLDLLLPPRAATIHHQHVTNFAESVGTARQMGERNELFARRHDGTEFPTEASISKLEINGEIICTAILRDISDRKQAELALSQQKEILQTIFDALPVMLCFVNDRGKIQLINPAFEQILGWSLVELQTIDNIIAELYPDPESCASVLEFLLKADGTWRDFQTRIRSGEMIDTTWSNIRLPDGSVLGIGQDITDRKQAELALQEREYRLRTLADNLPNGVIYQLVQEPTGKVYFSYITAGIERLLGIKPEVILQDANVLFDLTVEEDRQRRDQLTEESRRNLSVFEIQMRNRTPIGDIQWSYIRSAPRRLADGRTVWDGIEIDITELKKTEIELAQAKDAAEAANLAKSAFLASMSHELRTPLNGILGYAQILKNNPNLTQKQNDGIEIIHQCGTHLLTLINDILDLSKVEAGKLELYAEDFHFPSCLVGLCEIFRLKAIQKDIAFNYNAPTSMPQVVNGDEKRLRQVLMNLLSNAVKFTDKGSVTFTISIIYQGQSTKDKIRFQVEDTGIGMSAEDLNKIFLPFEQVKDSSRHHEGTGLGLAITKKLIALMGSQIRVESTPGVGSKFWFEVDLPEVSSSATFIRAKPMDIIVGYAGATRKILIVDDRWENCAVLRSVLEPIGFEIQEAMNGQEGLTKAQEWQPDLILVDVVMPVMNGHQMTQQLRQYPEFKTTPIIAVSANAFANNRVESLDAGCTDFITKPIATQELLQKVQVYLNISWVYQDKVEPANSYLESGDRVIPTQEELRILYEAASMGDVAGVEEETMRLQDINPDYIPFALEVLEMAAKFDYDKIVDLLDNYFGDW